MKGYVGKDREGNWISFYDTIGIRRNTYTAFVTGDEFDQIDINRKKSKLEETGISFEVFTGDKLIELSTVQEKDVTLNEWKQYCWDKKTVEALIGNKLKKHNKLCKGIEQKIEEAFKSLSIGLPINSELYRSYYYFKMKTPFNIKDSSSKILEVIGVLQHIQDKDWKNASNDVLATAIEYLQKNIETALIVKRYKDKFKK